MKRKHEKETREGNTKRKQEKETRKENITTEPLASTAHWAVYRSDSDIGFVLAGLLQKYESTPIVSN